MTLQPDPVPHGYQRLRLFATFELDVREGELANPDCLSNVAICLAALFDDLEHREMLTRDEAPYHFVNIHDVTVWTTVGLAEDMVEGAVRLNSKTEEETS